VDALDTGRSLLMTHMVGGFPTFIESLSIAETLIRSGADILEIQIPFTDPIADGPQIMEACSEALRNGATPAECFSLAREVRACFDVPVVLMTYFNLLLKAGIESFVDDAREAGVSGLIVPDLPLDSSEGALLACGCRRRNLWIVPVVSPGVRSERLKKVLPLGSGFVYATLKVGITGSSSLPSPDYAFLESIRSITHLPVLGGFGITTVKSGVEAASWADGAVVGSHLLRLFKARGEAGIAEFTSDLKAAMGKEKNNE